MLEPSDRRCVASNEYYNIIIMDKSITNVVRVCVGVEDIRWRFGLGMLHIYALGAIRIWLGCINIGATIDANPAGTIDAWLNG